MKKIYLKTILLFVSVMMMTNSFAQSSSDGLWSKLDTKQIAGDKVRRNSFPDNYYLFQLDLNHLRSMLVNAPVLFANNNQSSLIIEFPNAEGNFEKFKVYESSIMDPILEAKFPMIKTYAAQGIDDPTATMRFSVTQFGLHTMSLSGIKSTVYIDPYTSDLATYIVYNKQSLMGNPQTFECLTDEGVNLPSLQNKTANPLTVQNINDQKLRTFRLAQSCTGEYGAIFMGTGTVAQQKANVQAQMTITMNRVNGVYERDLSVHMNFIPNNDLLIYLNSTTDPWTNEWNTKTAQTIDAAIGVANYDIGHNFNTTGGGNAGCIACVCLSTSQTSTHKGRGYTGSTNPTGDAFDIDYVAHEMGHQYGGYHVMNTCSRSGSGASEVEPASGSSVMGYAGICPSNIQAHSDDDFNYVNIRDISVNLKTGSVNCAVITPLTDTPPTANAGLDYIIPKSTAYILEGTGSDVDGNASLTYNWGENDPAQSPGNASPLPTYSVGPMYRSIPPSTSPNRYMPALATVLSNTISSTWEVTPSVGRTLNFSFIVRDNSVGGGQTASDLMMVTVNAAAGPFSVTSQNTATTWTAATTQTITWNVAGTATTSVNTPSVNIFLSTDGGYTYPITIASNVPNNGSAIITVPSVTTTAGRFMVRGAGNIFYDINNTNLTIVAAPLAAPVSNFSVAAATLCTGSNIQLNDQSLNAPTSWTWTATNPTGVSFSNANAQSPTVTFANAGTYTISLIAKNSLGQSTSNKTVTVVTSPTVAVTSSTICSGNSAALTASGATTYNWSNSATTSSISVSPTSNTSYTVIGTTNGCSNSIVSNVTVKTTPTVAVNSSTICSGNSTALTASGATTYSWSNAATTSSISVSPTSNTSYTVIGTTNGCTNTKIANVTVKTTPTVAVNNSTICSGNSTALTASGATTYSWSNAATTASISVAPTSNTSYTVIGTTNGCSNSIVSNVTVKTTPTVTANSSTICSGNSTALTASGATTYSWSNAATTASISVSPSITTNYTVIGTTNGCSNSKVVTVNVNTTPTVSVNSSTICSGNSATLTASGATTYSWDSGSTGQNISVAPTANTTYTVTGTTNGCSNYQTANVTVNNLPVVSFALTSSLVCVSDPAIILNGTPAGGIYTGTGVTGNTFDPSGAGAGTYTIMYSYTDGNSCSNSDNKTITVDLCTGVKELSNGTFAIYPNPTNGTFNIDFNTVITTTIEIEIFDAIGKLVLTQTTVNNHNIISLDQFAKGIYNVRLKNNGSYSTVRVIKE